MYAHTITAQLSCHLKHFVAIGLLIFVEIQKIFNCIQTTMKLSARDQVSRVTSGIVIWQLLPLPYAV